jgi:hypothetical protein
MRSWHDFGGAAEYMRGRSAPLTPRSFVLLIRHRSRPKRWRGHVCSVTFGPRESSPRCRGPFPNNSSPNGSGTPRPPARSPVALGLYLLSIAALQWSDLRLAAHAPGVTKPALTFGRPCRDPLDPHRVGEVGADGIRMGAGVLRRSRASSPALGASRRASGRRTTRPLRGRWHPPPRVRCVRSSG